MHLRKPPHCTGHANPQPRRSYVWLSGQNFKAEQSLPYTGENRGTNNLGRTVAFRNLWFSLNASKGRLWIDAETLQTFIRKLTHGSKFPPKPRTEKASRPRLPRGGRLGRPRGETPGAAAVLGRSGTPGRPCRAPGPPRRQGALARGGSRRCPLSPPAGASLLGYGARPSPAAASKGERRRWWRRLRRGLCVWLLVVSDAASAGAGGD